MARADPAGPARRSLAGRVALVAGGAGTDTELVSSCAENANHSLHNIQTLRGVRTRDARNFARYLDETLERWGDEAEVHWGPHTWPVWGNENIATFIGSQRDTYKYIHDQALRLANKGYTPLEAAEVIEAADYRWAAEILHKLVFAEPGNTEAKSLQADAYEQMGYQAEGPQWRGIFLTAAKELREGVQPAPFTTVSPDTTMRMPIHLLFDFAAVHVIGDKAADADLRIDFTFTDYDQTWTMWVRRGGPNAPPRAPPPHPPPPSPPQAPQLPVSGPKAALVGAVLQPAAAAQLAQAGKIQLDGDHSVLATFAGLLDEFDADFNIVTP